MQVRDSDPLDSKSSSHVTVATEPGCVLLVNAILPLATVPVMLGHWVTAVTDNKSSEFVISINPQLYNYMHEVYTLYIKS